MKRLLLVLLVGLGLALPVKAQQGNTTTIRFAGAPTGNCAPLTFGINSATGALYDCVAGAWTLVGSPGGGAVPGGTGTQVQYRAGASTFGGITGSSVGPAGEVALSTTAAAALNALSVTVADDDTDQLNLKNASSPAGSNLRFVKSNDGSVTIRNDVNPMGAGASSSITFAPGGGWNLDASNGTLEDFIACTGDGTGCLTATNFGAPTFNKVTITAPASGSTLTILNGKVATFNKTLTFDGTDSTTMTFPSVSATITRTVASGAKALATTQINSGACSAAQTDTATGTLTTDTVAADFNADPTGVTGYAPVTTGMLTIVKYPTADTVNFKVCNLTALAITPGAITLNWRVTR